MSWFLQPNFIFLLIKLKENLTVYNYGHFLLIEQLRFIIHSSDLRNIAIYRFISETF